MFFGKKDIRALLAVLAEVENTGAELQSYGTFLQEENKQKERRKKLAERKRLFAMMCTATRRQVALLDMLAEQLEDTQDEAQARQILGKIAVLGAYLKRRSNLIFLTERRDVVGQKELRLCLHEWVDQ